MKAIAAGEAEAKKNNWLIAVVDSGSRLVAFLGMDGAQLGSIDIAMGKAMTSKTCAVPPRTCRTSSARAAPTFACWRRPA
jgi:uncharacterized protein GlcG (DUF336 family)